MCDAKSRRKLFFAAYDALFNLVGRLMVRRRIFNGDFARDLAGALARVARVLLEIFECTLSAGLVAFFATALVNFLTVDLTFDFTVDFEGAFAVTRFVVLVWAVTLFGVLALVAGLLGELALVAARADVVFARDFVELFLVVAFAVDLAGDLAFERVEARAEVFARGFAGDFLADDLVDARDEDFAVLLVEALAGPRFDAAAFPATLFAPVLAADFLGGDFLALVAALEAAAVAVVRLIVWDPPSGIRDFVRISSR